MGGRFWGVGLIGLAGCFVMPRILEVSEVDTISFTVGVFSEGAFSGALEGVLFGVEES